MPKTSAIRTIHHFAASGGTIMSKAIAAQLNTVVLSEVSPRLLGVRFNPFDPVEQFLAGPYARIIKDSHEHAPPMVIAEDIFRERLNWVHTVCNRINQVLVLRDHSHSDFMGASCKENSSLLKVLDTAGTFRKSIVTIRYPIESFLSAQKLGWVEHAPCIEQYCSRLLLMLNDFQDDEVFLYEDFCNDPVAVTKAMCAYLDIDFDIKFLSRLKYIRLTGDSGRSGNEIVPRDPKPVPADLAKQAKESQSFAEIAKRFGYKINP